MQRKPTINRRVVTGMLLISLLLESCYNLAIPTSEKDIVLATKLPKAVELNAPKQQLLKDREFNTREGYSVSFYQQATSWRAKVVDRDNLQYDLPLIAAEIDTNHLNTLSKKGKKQCIARLIDIELPKGSKPGWIRLGTKGLMGGGKHKDGVKEQEKEIEHEKPRKRQEIKREYLVALAAPVTLATLPSLSKIRRNSATSCLLATNFSSSTRLVTSYPFACSMYSTRYLSAIPILPNRPDFRNSYRGSGLSRAYTTSHAGTGDNSSKKSLFIAGGVSATGVGTYLAMAAYKEEDILEENSQKSHPKEKEDSQKANKLVKKHKRILSDYRPNDGTHLHYAVQSYKNVGGEVENAEWKIIDISSNKENSYFGAAYCNTAKKHIIIAHRGTEELDLKDWKTNVDIITRHLNDQQAYAWDFSKKVIEEYGPAYSYSFTGHSLGGWLASTCLYEYEAKFGKDKVYQSSLAVTFDDPGAKQVLKALQPRLDKDHRIDINKLDITSYLSLPNIVNTAMEHVGSTYTIAPEMQFSWLQKKLLQIYNDDS